MGPRGPEAMNFGITWNLVKEQLLHNFMKYFSGPWANQIVNKNLNDESSCFSNCHFQLCKKWCLQNFYSVKKQMMLLKLWHCWLIWYLFAGFKTLILCSGHSIWFVKYLLSAKIWFLKTSTRIVKCESQVIKLNLGTHQKVALYEKICNWKIDSIGQANGSTVV